MPDRPRQMAAMLVAALVTAPLLALIVRAAASQWRAPDLVPSEFSWRGVNVAMTGANASAFSNSMIVAAATASIALVIGWPAARALGERRARRPALLLLIAAPLLIPSYAVGTGLSPWFIRLGIDGTLAAIIIGHLTFVLPYVILVLLSGFGPRLTSLEEMAGASGLSRRQRLAWVTLPSVMPTVAAAALVGFLVSWSDYGTSLAVGGGRPMLPVVLLPFVGADPQVAATLALVFLVPAVAALLLASRGGRMPT